MTKKSENLVKQTALTLPTKGVNLLPVSAEVMFAPGQTTEGSSCDILTAYMYIKEIQEAGIEFTLEDPFNLPMGISCKYKIVVGDSGVGGLLINNTNPLEIGLDERALWYFNNMLKLEA